MVIAGIETPSLKMEDTKNKFAIRRQRCVALPRRFHGLLADGVLFMKKKTLLPPLPKGEIIWEGGNGQFEISVALQDWLDAVLKNLRRKTTHRNREKLVNFFIMYGVKDYDPLGILKLGLS